MSSSKRIVALAGALVFIAPSAAYASPGFDVPGTVSTVTGVCSLLLAAMLLLVVMRLREVAEGSAIADNIAYVMGATVCFAAAITLGWIARFVDFDAAGYVRAGGDVLVMLSVLLFAIYFARVRRALTRFLAHLNTDDVLVASQGVDVTEDDVA